mgnify:CR=1 FL=1
MLTVRFKQLGLTPGDLVLDAGAEEINDLGETFEIISDASAVVKVRQALQGAKIDYESADTPFLPTMYTPMSKLTTDEFAIIARFTTKFPANSSNSYRPRTVSSRWVASPNVMLRVLPIGRFLRNEYASAKKMLSGVRSEYLVLIRPRSNTPSTVPGSMVVKY